MTQNTNNIVEKRETAILVFIYNRPDFTIQIFKQLEKLKPAKLYIASDGAKNEKERTIIEESRSIFNTISWECDAKYNYSDRNIGLRKRIVSGIDWAFKEEEQLIILEDDCLPHPDFFPFCEAMLGKYKENERIMTINGCNLNPSISLNNKETYFYSRYANSWGWATWRSAWQHFDSELSGLKNPEMNSILKSHFTSPIRTTLYWKYKLNEVRSNRINSWAFRWMFTLFVNKALAIVPRNNLIRNIGSDSRSTNTKGKLHFMNIPMSGINVTDIVDPADVYPDNIYDSWVENSIYSKSFKFRLNWIIRKIFFQP